LKAAVFQLVSFEMSDILRAVSQSDNQQDIYERKYYALKGNSSRKVKTDTAPQW